ncbi:RNA-directed DNA polymerase [Snuella sedimenti]|uniref:RNA-directed DNA polymerase n=1 Tax=Snuella sedimenti TaxID=2798802 RepID=A0A8J7J439_9FLAO|nr:RNA-directed DNA polymerase [Snuella sedimenti]MBJ6368138.1 RNA-directed DNA polymerase [Snuella sedimenti]
MLTDRFNKLRKTELDKVFGKLEIINIWRSIVKNQLRKLDIQDLYDFYDFNYNIDERALAIRTEILNGNYQVIKPIIYRLEKKLGICRHIVIPQPQDALVLQVLTEQLNSEIIGKMPSENSFYSQDKHNMKYPHDLDTEYGVNWQKQWKKLQKLIYQFSESKELLVVTDLSNYFDSIDISVLRNQISNIVDDKEVLLDLLFKIIENISWNPDYLKYTGRGLPTSNLEGIRLLAHSFLFEFDAILKEKTNNSFTRWMDDVVIGVNSRQEAIEMLSSSSDVLKSRGLALNLAKTDIYDSEKAEFHFQIDQNKYLDSIDYNIKPRTSKYNLKTSELKREFKKHLKETKAKYSEKITKRYVTAFGKFKSEKLLSEVALLYNERPGIRGNLLIYLSELGYKKKTSDTVINIIKNLNVYDDISLFQVCKLVTDWDIPDNESSLEFLRTFEIEIKSISQRRKNPFDFYCLIWFKSKYEHPDSLLRFIKDYENIWKSEPFLRRQVTASLSRAYMINPSKVTTILKQQISTGIPQIVSLSSQLLSFSSFENLPSRIHLYLFPTHKQKRYPLSKFLVLCSLLNSEKIRTNEIIKSKVKEYIVDDYQKKWIEAQYNIR